MPGAAVQQNPAAVNMRQGDWLCRACGNHNFADKAHCNRCTVPKHVYIAAVLGASPPSRILHWA